jgi:hypothetical protein
VIAPRTPAFGVHSPDKHWVVATQPQLTMEYIGTKLDPFYKNRMRSLRSVDDVVAALHGAVAAAGQLNRTYFVFTSDHVSNTGQHNTGVVLCATSDLSGALCSGAAHGPVQPRRVQASAV